MDIKAKAHILKKRSKELGYDIKLTHAQEIISALYGHKSRHSALLADTKAENQDSNKLIEDNETFDFYFKSKDFPEDRYEIGEKAFNVGLVIGRKYGSKLSNLLSSLIKESNLYNEEDKFSYKSKERIFSRALYYGLLMALASKLDIWPLQQHMRQLEDQIEKPSSISGLDIIQKILKKRTESMWERMKKL